MQQDDQSQDPGVGLQTEQDEQERQREQEQAAKLLDCEKLFTQPDSIMEPGILVVLRRYLELGGSPQNAVDFLTDKYVGKVQPRLCFCSLHLCNDTMYLTDKCGGKMHPHLSFSSCCIPLLCRHVRQNT